MSANNIETSFPIDAVITWVDGNDPAHKASRFKYSHNGEEFKLEDVAADTRFNDVGEIKYCIASLFRFAPWLRKIYIVTDNQNPHVEEYLDRYFPDRTIPIEIIDHKVIFSGYEQYLPVFNSLAIETMLWRIPNLSEHFIYFNDDLLLVNPVTSEDFFKNGKLLFYGKWRTFLKRKISLFFKRCKGERIDLSYKLFVSNSANLLGEKRRFPKLYHTAHPQLKSIFEEYYAEHEDSLIKNIHCKFRENSQYNSQALNYLIGIKKGICQRVRVKGKYLYLKPKYNKGEDYVKKKLFRFAKRPHALFCCFNSLDLAKKDDLALILSWIFNRLNVGE